MATYNETDRSRVVEMNDHDTVYTVYGIANTTNDVSIPAKGDFLDGTAGTACTHAVCVDVQKDPYWQKGRVLIVSKWVGHAAAVTLGP